MARPQSALFTLGKLLQGIGLVVVLAGVLMSINLGMDEQGLASMAIFDQFNTDQQAIAANVTDCFMTLL